MNLFYVHWCEHVRSFPFRYRTAKQIIYGSRLRPLLVAWGYLLAGADFDNARRSDIAKLAVYVELLHKATILIDDLVDGDSARNGEECFHSEFSDSEAILFAIYLLGDAIERLVSPGISVPANDWYRDATTLLAAAIKEMSSGALEEVTSDGTKLTVLSRAKRLIELQTTALMKNGMLTGYKYGQGNAKHAQTIESMGHDSGYIFQVLNDLEPFLGADQNKLHKGAVNFDVLRSRKNITVAFVCNRLRPAERAALGRLMDAADPSLPSTLIDLFVKYDVLRDVLGNLRDVRNNLEATTNRVPVDVERRRGFCTFMNYVLSAAIGRIGGLYGEKLSDILIK